MALISILLCSWVSALFCQEKYEGTITVTRLIQGGTDKKDLDSLHNWILGESPLPFAYEADTLIDQAIDALMLRGDNSGVMKLFIRIVVMSDHTRMSVERGEYLAERLPYLALKFPNSLVDVYCEFREKERELLMEEVAHWEDQSDGGKIRELVKSLSERNCGRGK